MKKTLITIAFAVASVPMFAAQTPANPPASGSTTQAKPVVKKHQKKAVKKVAPKKEAAPVAK
jgi:hypothetical protein